MDVSRQRIQPAEVCRLREVIERRRGTGGYGTGADVVIAIDVCGSMELPLERARMERVFLEPDRQRVGSDAGRGRLRISAAMRREVLMVHIGYRARDS